MRITFSVPAALVWVSCFCVKEVTGFCVVSGCFSHRHAWSSLASTPPSSTGNDDTPSVDGSDDNSSEQKKDDDIMPDILLPFPPASDPMYMCRGAIGEGSFIVKREGEPRKEELSNENILKIVKIQCSDLEVNTLVWKGLGYRYDAEAEIWNNEEVFPKWKEKFPAPPDLIGMQRIYEKEVDQPSLRANQQLVRSVPVESKQSLKKHLKPVGFPGYKYKELTPNKTRRAQCANWLLFFREELFGFSLEELRERKRLKQEAKEAEDKRLQEETGKPVQDEWKPPVKEVF
mmetsp:Transcript_26969/g.25831  ORF Transcript_26969/g.25831 Transcript_26969/m.25831 type:complete len:288 (-) Transcript_26969:442-1305(-)|eukprot:CAMPEP_0197835548 /NCGR_PEP_ID=MMETSP1437-20131217/26136_1 /TAXON_ID=49252 ORGANISM="Eucampia antarctica, Strain CCMP1452" /NCGR_SAMPLE_ID=MMETSP1437 /ASSEMBLY_ACC=CAM_ASM_001096 /LENGTH=287 /DNA_ID=CAMNT_0043441083 /DNA_START=166 /DNA_END=1029 /DNA_ORIENTATION=-